MGGALAAFALWGVPLVAQSAPERPVILPITPPPSYRRALAQGTRTAEGKPGPRYWTNHSSYDMRLELDAATGRITGSETILYQNNSPDTLSQLALNTYLDIHRPGTIRNEVEEVTPGVELKRLEVNGAALTEGALDRPGRWQRRATVVRLRPPRPLLPGATAKLTVEWALTLPQNSSGRVGWSRREVYFVGYFYPRMAVYDDLRGWDAQPYLGNAELYDDFGDYHVALTVPAGWTVMATGTLENPGAVWSEQTRRRLAAAAGADTVVHVATRADRAARVVTAAPASGKLTYRFAADTVRDFTWTASNVQLWDATSARVAGRGARGERVAIHAFWRDDRAPLWAEAASYGKTSVEHHSRFTGLAYPWPHMTVVEGEDIVGGGMEFPMLTVISAYRNAQSLFGTIAHEIGHMWVPMIVGANEKRYAWMDEGNATFLEDLASEATYGPGAFGDERDSYLRAARAETELPLMTGGDAYETVDAYLTASYPKPATLLNTLRGLLGAETFGRAYAAFLSEWAFKLPAPWDLFATFERFAGQDLDWFWRSFYYETWTLDQAVAGVGVGPRGTVVTIANQGLAVLPALVRIETTRGGTIERTIPVDRWLAGALRADLELPADLGDVTRVEIDPEQRFPDIDRADNVWIAR